MDKDYFSYFSNQAEKCYKHEEAFKRAWDIRNFEIELYWKRATYFWTLIAATMAGYALVFTKIGNEDKSEILLLLSCIGLDFSVAWFCVNRGSKFWIENWEAHIVELEDKSTGPLYKMTMFDKNKKDKHFWISSKKYSVSNINQILSLFVIAIFLVLIHRDASIHLCSPWYAFFDCADRYKVCFIIFSIIAVLLIIVNGDLKNVWPNNFKNMDYSIKDNFYDYKLRKAHPPSVMSNQNNDTN